MQWEKRSPYFVESACGRYRISKAGPQGRVKYTAWVDTGQAWEMLGVTTDRHKAAALCDAHLEGSGHAN